MHVPHRGRSCSITTIRNGFSVGYGSRYSVPLPTNRTASGRNVFFVRRACARRRLWRSRTASVLPRSVSLAELLDALSPSPRDYDVEPRCMSTMLTALPVGRLLEVQPGTAVGGLADSPRDQWISVLSPHHRVQTTTRRRRASEHRDTCVCPPLPKDTTTMKKSDHQILWARM